MKAKASVTIHGHRIEITNPDKVLFPDAHITKIEVVDYYQKIADVMLPFMKNRALSLFRFPDGIKGEKFYQKKAPDYFPEWFARATIHHRSGGVDYYPMCNNTESIVYLANYVCVPHVWLSKYDKLDYPDRLIFDLDPSGDDDFESARVLALFLRSFLGELGLASFPLLTGSRGMHVIVPIKRTKTFDEVRDFAQRIASFIVHAKPERYTTALALSKRKGRLFIDTLRNSFGATAVAPYAVRDKESAPIAAPIAWREVEDSSLTSRRYTINNVFKALALNPWPDFEKSAVALTMPIKKLASLWPT